MRTRLALLRQLLQEKLKNRALPNGGRGGGLYISLLCSVRGVRSLLPILKYCPFRWVSLIPLKVHQCVDVVFQGLLELAFYPISRHHRVDYRQRERERVRTGCSEVLCILEIFILRRKWRG
jgi:hypothetical protein